MRGPREHPSEDGEPSQSDRGGALGETFFEEMVASATDAVITADVHGNIVYANDAVERLLGYAPEDIRGREFGEFVPERLRDRYEGWYRRFADGDDGTPISDESFEVTWLTADGEEVRVSVSAFEHGADETFFTGFLERAPTDSESAERLREEEALIEEIFDTSPVAFAVRDHEGELLRANDRAAELVGVGSDELPAEEDDEWMVYDTDGRELSEDEYPVMQVLDAGEPVYNEEVIVEQPNGKRVHLSVSVAPVYDDGEVQRVVSAAEDITELKQTQFELEQRRDELETELSEVFSRVTDAFFALDTDWNFTYVNDEAEELIQRSEEGLLGESIWDEFSEAVGTTFQREYERAMDDQEPVSFAEYYPPLSTWFEVRAYPSETGLSVYFRDVTDRKQRERELERYETIVETVEDGIYVVGPDNEFSMVNTSFAELVGYDSDDLVGTDPSRLYDEETREEAASLMQEIIDGERTSATIEHLLQTSDGETFSAETTFVVRETENGDYERVGVTRDVTERKERERELQNRVEQQRVLSEFSQYALEARSLDDLFDEAVELVADVLDHDYCKVLELYPEDDELLLRNGVGWREGIVGSATVADDRGSQAGYTLLTEEPVVVEDLEAEERFSGPDLLNSHDVESGISTIIGTPDDVWGILGVHDTESRSYADHDVQFVRSIAHILLTSIQRREHERELRERNERLDAFASMLAHELRNPLEIAQIYLDMGVESAIGSEVGGGRDSGGGSDSRAGSKVEGESEVGGEHEGEGDGGESAFREVERALDRIEQMIDTLLVVTRRGGDVDNTEPVALDEVAAEWWDDVDPDGDLVVETDAEILADPSRLRQLLENLYRNAAEHGGSDVTVRVGDLSDSSAGTSGATEATGFYVADDGPGIPPEDREEVFNPGYSTSNVGIGFGLAVVRQLVEAHGWECEITESEAGGARFEFRGVETPE
ncbi:PAS domain-containing sensor histidine kinase [Halorussus ruber]|uniref:PAS domain-containing sensor histidine kinase n=1 Tax=Halorussus ruber TaxID=1126238 RepID=UPI001092F828|nr:PAS domain S-box protein [Halorussus ruber]